MKCPHNKTRETFDNDPYKRLALACVERAVIDVLYPPKSISYDDIKSAKDFLLAEGVEMMEACGIPKTKVIEKLKEVCCETA